MGCFCICSTGGGAEGGVDSVSEKSSTLGDREKSSFFLADVVVVGMTSKVCGVRFDMLYKMRSFQVEAIQGTETMFRSVECRSLEKDFFLFSLQLSLLLIDNAERRSEELQII